jgi:hypothetical protein
MLILNITERHKKIVKLPYYNKVLKNISKYVNDSHHFDINYIPVALHFCNEVMTAVDYGIL